jgi:uncharacterized protein
MEENTPSYSQIVGIAELQCQGTKGTRLYGYARVRCSLRNLSLIAVGRRKVEDGDAQGAMPTTLLNLPSKRFALSAAILSVAFCASPTRITDAQTASVPAAAAVTLEMQSWQQNLKTWRTQREMQVSARDGWLTLAGLEWLKQGVNTIGSAADNSIQLPASAPAHLALLTVMDGAHVERTANAKTSEATIVQLLSPPGGFPPDFTVDGKAASEGSLQVDGPSASTMAWRALSFAVLKRDDRMVLRIKDADSPARTSFKVLNWYPPDPVCLVTARWIPFRPAIIQEIPTVIGTMLKLPAPGLAMFMLNGKIMQLEPVIEDPASKSLFFILRDETSKTSTYGGGRFLHTGLPDHGLNEPGNLVLDFNQLENPPCAYTNFATCPLPPKQNQLETEIKAGEKRYER